MKVIKIPYDISIPLTVCSIGESKDNSDEEAGRVLDDIKQLINIEWAEIVAIFNLKSSDAHRDFCLIVDECGKLKENWEEKINIRASYFYRGSYFGDYIVGDVVFLARQWNERFGDCDLAGLTLDEIASFQEKLYEVL